jgi:hypothetical protein
MVGAISSIIVMTGANLLTSMIVMTDNNAYLLRVAASCCKLAPVTPVAPATTGEAL